MADHGGTVVNEAPGVAEALAQQVAARACSRMTVSMRGPSTPPGEMRFTRTPERRSTALRALSHNAANPIEYFGLPPERTLTNVYARYISLRAIRATAMGTVEFTAGSVPAG